MSVFSNSPMDMTHTAQVFTESEWCHLMGELGGMSAGYPPNTQREICPSFDAEPHPQHFGFPPCNTILYPVPVPSYPSPPEMNVTPPQCWENNTYSSYDPHQIPQLIITEEPISKIRFRYQSERGSHGSMSGRSSNNTQKSWPTVQLINYVPDPNSSIKVRASLVTEDRTRPHVHKLLGKTCLSDTGDCTLPLNPDMTCSFASLGVLFTEKKKVHEVLYNRKLEELEESSLSEETKKKFLDQARQEVKEFKLNSIRICFQAFHGATNEPITDCVYSEAVHNLKSPESGELKISRLSRYSSTCQGGEEVFLLCEKVNKKDIKVKFYQQDEKGHEVWHAFGKFADSDVHHQVAIVFKTPPYRDPHIEKAVKVFIQLYRGNDQETSESKEFTYKPYDRDPDQVQLKKRRLNDPEEDYKGFGGHDHSFMNSQNQFLPSTSHSPWAPEGGAGASEYTMMPPNGGHNYQANNMAAFVQNFAEELQMSSSSGSSQDSYKSAESSHTENMAPSAPPAAEVQSLADSFLQDPLPAHGATNNIMDTSVSPTMLAELGAHGVTMSTMDTSVSPTMFARSEDSLFEMPLPALCLENIETDGSLISRKIDYFKPAQIELSKDDVISSKMSALNLGDPEPKKRDPKKDTTDYKKDLSKGPKDKKPESKREPESKPESKREPESRREFGEQPIGSGAGKRQTDAVFKAKLERFVSKQMVPRFGHYLRRFTSTGNVQALLWPLAPFLASQNEEGDNAVHLAIIHQSENKWLFQQLMHVVSSLMPYNVINHTNNIYQTPLHLAVAVNEVSIVQWLLLSGADPTVQDQRGNTPLHLAALHKNSSCLAILLNKASYNIRTSTQSLPNPNCLNYDGHSVLHLCVLVGLESGVSLLVDAGADVNIQDGTSGRTPLHLAVEMQSPLVEQLLQQPSIDVDSVDYAGNTPLHLACSYQFKEIVHVLMQADANPLAQNFIYDEEDDDGEFTGKTPVDLINGNEQLKSILAGLLSPDDSSRLNQSRRKSMEEQNGLISSPKSDRRDSSGPSTSSETYTKKEMPDKTEGLPRNDSGNFSTTTSDLKEKHESGYDTGSGFDTGSHILSWKGVDEVMIEGLCERLDPPSRNWEKLAGLFCETRFIDGMKKLETSPTRTLLKKMQENGWGLKESLEAAGLNEACAFLKDLENVL